jgi:hypothetical protein
MKYQKGYVKKGDKLSPSRRKIISLHNARYWLGKKRSKDMIERISKKLKGRILGPSKIVPRMNIFCKYCGNKFLVRITDYKRDKVEFCKKKCYSKWQEKNTCGTASPAWKGSVSKNILLRMRKKYEIQNTIYNILKNLVHIPPKNNWR